jgi:hypothetical protein
VPQDIKSLTRDELAARFAEWDAPAYREAKSTNVASLVSGPRLV